MHRKIFRSTTAAVSKHARALAAGYRIIGKPGSAGTLPMMRFSTPVTPFWHPTLLDTLQAPLTRHRE